MKTPKSLRLHIGLFGRTNVGKSSLLNMIAGQDVAITSPVPGTTTDVVEKAMELLPVGPVVFLDTGGLDDTSALADSRIRRSRAVFDRSEVVFLVTEPDAWTPFEDQVCEEAGKRKLPLIVIVNKTDLAAPSADFSEKVRSRTPHTVFCSALESGKRDAYVDAVKARLIDACPDDFLKPPPLVGDLLPAGGLAVLIVPIDLEAPKGRLILPQVQTIRDALDSDAAALVVKEREYPHYLERLGRPPDLVICDSQVVLKMVADTPPAVPCTTFSILFARSKSDLSEMARGAAAISRLRPGDRVLVAEACSHHAVEDDIGRVKIPRWLRQYVGGDLDIRTHAGCDWPEDVGAFKLVIHCGSCMMTRRQTLARLQKAREAGVPVTNYGIGISFLQGVAERVLSPFPAALDAYRASVHSKKEALCHGDRTGS